ncbi:MAG: D-2-hydroxyacid dehydrogenase [Candidatus Dormibacteria bacterium]
MTPAGKAPVRCLILGEKPPPDLELIRESVPEQSVELVQPEPGVDLSRLGEFDVIWRIFPGKVDGVARDQLEEALGSHPEVRWVHTASAGIDGLGQLFQGRPQTRLTHSAGVTAIPISEFVVGCLLQHCKRTAELEQQQRQRHFAQLQLRELRDLRVVLYGLGAIGSAVAHRLAAFECHLVGVRRSLDRGGPPEVAQLFGPPDLARACSGADALVVAAPLTPQTERSVGARVLAPLAEGSVVVNVARGGLVDEKALLAGLLARRPAAAYLDAFAEEPLPAGSPLWTTPGVHVSPHISWSSAHLGRRSSELFAEQLRRWVAGETLLNQADPREGY